MKELETIKYDHTEAMTKSNLEMKRSAIERKNINELIKKQIQHSR